MKTDCCSTGLFYFFSTLLVLSGTISEVEMSAIGQMRKMEGATVIQIQVSRKALPSWNL